jgi:hypothetical protein
MDGVVASGSGTKGACKWWKSRHHDFNSHHPMTRGVRGRQGAAVLNQQVLPARIARPVTAHRIAW